PRGRLFAPNPLPDPPEEFATGRAVAAAVRGRTTTAPVTRPESHAHEDPAAAASDPAPPRRARRAGRAGHGVHRPARRGVAGGRRRTGPPTAASPGAGTC